MSAQGMPCMACRWVRVVEVYRNKVAVISCANQSVSEVYARRARSGMFGQPLCFEREPGADDA